MDNQQQLEEEEDFVYYGILNPVGEDDGADSTYWEKQQLQQVAPMLTGLNLYINHQTHTQKGEEILPCGKVLGAGMDEKGRLWCAVLPFKEDKNGQLANHFLSHGSDKFKMAEFSMGYDVAYNEEDKAIGNRPTEVSICFQGAREGTRIKGRLPFKDFLRDGLSREYVMEEGDHKEEETFSAPDFQNYNKDTKEDAKTHTKELPEIISDTEELIADLNLENQTIRRRMDTTGNSSKEIDGSKLVGRHGAVIIPTPQGWNGDAQPQEGKKTSSQQQDVMRNSRFEGMREPQFRIPQQPQQQVHRVVQAAASGQMEVDQAAAAPPTQQQQAPMKPVTGEVISSQMDALLQEVFPDGLPQDVDEGQGGEQQTTTAMPTPSAPALAQINEAQLSGASPEEIKQLLLKLTEQNQNLSRELQRATISDKERAQADELEIKENQAKILPFIKKIQEVKGEANNLKRHNPKMLEFMNHLVDKPGLGSLAISNYLSAAASLCADQENALKRSADKLESEYQADQRKNKLIKLQKDKIDQLLQENQQIKGSRSMFEQPEERVQYTRQAVASNFPELQSPLHQQQYGGGGGLQRHQGDNNNNNTPQADVINSTFFDAIKVGNERSYNDNVPENFIQGQANFLGDLFDTYGSTDVGMPMLTKNDFNF